MSFGNVPPDACGDFPPALEVACSDRRVSACPAATLVPITSNRPIKVRNDLIFPSWQETRTQPLGAILRPGLAGGKHYCRATISGSPELLRPNGEASYFSV